VADEPLTPDELVERARERRRQAELRRRQGRRRLAILAGGLVALVTIVVLAIGGGDETQGDDAPVPPLSRELPRGGRLVLPRFRVVAYYGAPQARELGTLGIGTPAQAARRLERQAREYDRPRRPVLPALELIAVVAANSPGDDGLYRTRQAASTIRRYLEAARRARALLLLDVQPGHARFLDEVLALEPFLREPDVGLALDPEWHLPPGQVPGATLGSMDAAEVNQVSSYLANLVRRHRLPEKLLVVHQFTAGMVKRKHLLQIHPGVATVLDVDGFGTAAQKIDKYRELTAGPAARFAPGLKLFYEEDTGLLSPREVLRLRPQPQVVIYE
jgi:hypothetical protein